MNEKLGNRIDTDDLKKIQINILDYVVDFCKKNNINYFLDAGTLLGSIRHSGYIPWDDDIDIGMLRVDYNKFINLFNEKSDRYKAYCIENEKTFLYPYCKILDTKTILYEPNKKGNKISVNIDLFPFDNAPDDDKVLYKMYRRRDNLRKFHGILNNDVSGKSLFKRLVVRLIRILIPRHYFVMKITRLEQKYCDVNTKRVSSFSGYNSSCCDKNAFKKLLDSKFEGKKYKVPVGYDLWLRALYGDYMKLPPKEKQVTHHQFEAYYKK